MPDDEKLKIALKALLKLSEYHPHQYSSVWVHETAQEALLEIRRDHYLGTSSSVVAEVLAGVRV